MCFEAEYQPFAQMHWKTTRNLDVSIDMELLLLMIRSSSQIFHLVWDTNSTFMQESSDKEDWAGKRNRFWTWDSTNFRAEMAPGQQK